MRKTAEKAAAFLAGAVLLATGLELALRISGGFYAARLPGPAAETAYTVLCVGDSFTFGAGAPEGSSYPVQLEAVLKERFPGRPVRVVNFGEVAQNTAQLLERLPQALDETRPDAVVLLSGMANFWNYWGYRDGTGGPRRRLLDRLRVARLARLLWREASRLLAERSVRSRQARQQKCNILPEHITCVARMKNFGDADGAIAACRTAVEKCPRDVDALLNVGFAYLNSHRPDEALSWLKRAVKAAPANPMAYIGISNALGSNRTEAERWMRLGAERTGGATGALFSGKYDVAGWIKLDLGAAIDLAEARGARVLLQNYPGAEREETTVVSNMLKETAAARALPFVDQAGVFSRLLAKAPRDEYFAYKDPHCSAKGYRVMAEQVASALEKHGFLKKNAAR